MSRVFRLGLLVVAVAAPGCLYPSLKTVESTDGSVFDQDAKVQDGGVPAMDGDGRGIENCCDDASGVDLVPDVSRPRDVGIAAYADGVDTSENTPQSDGGPSDMTLDLRVTGYDSGLDAGIDMSASLSGTGGAVSAGGSAGTGGTGGAVSTGGSPSTGGLTGVDAPIGPGGTAGSGGSTDSGDIAAGGGDKVFCGPPTQSIFRDSFDSSELVTGAGWSSNSSGGGRFSLDKVNFRSGPASAVALLPAVSDMTLTNATMSINSMNTHLPTAYLSFDVKISTTCVSRMLPGGSSFIAGVSPSMLYSLYVSVEEGTPNTLCVEEFKGTGTTFPNAARQVVKLDEWQHVELQIRFSGEPLGFLKVADGAAQSFTPHPNASATVGDGPLSFFIGPYLTGPSDGCAINYDNIVFDAPAACP